jgi:hypothetical protein
MYDLTRATLRSPVDIVLITRDVGSRGYEEEFWRGLTFWDDGSPTTELRSGILQSRRGVAVADSERCCWDRPDVRSMGARHNHRESS